MKYSLLLVALLASTSLMAEETQLIEGEQATVTAPAPITVICNDAQQEKCEKENVEAEEKVLTHNSDVRISVVGQGVAPMTTSSPAQAYALAKRAAIADAYRLIAEKVKGVRVEGQDIIKNMMVKRSTVRTSVDAMVRQANIVETTFKEGLCEIEMEIVLSHSQFAR
ncbi:MAG: LPP20 family lipoprotein [Campylobacterota bacterium]|nr:LPP20 family lipoprotein [Campylobacterota bacterium]